MIKFRPKCTNCGEDRTPGQGWHLNDYHGLTGYFCSGCYDLVSHDSYGNPNHPGDYLMILLKQSDRSKVTEY